MYFDLILTSPLADADRDNQRLNGSRRIAASTKVVRLLKGLYSQSTDEPGDMATNGPYFSQMLVLVLYLSGIRFTTSLNEEQRQARSERFLDILMGLLMIEMRKPSRIPTIRKSPPWTRASVVAGEPAAPAEISEMRMMKRST